MPDFLTHQSNGSVERFWPRVYEDWYTQWPITPTPQEIAEAGSASGAILIFRNENNKVRILARLFIYPYLYFS